MNKTGIDISSSQLEDFIWMSYRYCIGRRTIAAAMHANTIASILKKNPNVISEDRLSFMMEDIRMSIFEVLRWNSNIKIAGSINECVHWDVYSKLLVAASTCSMPKNVIYTIDTSNQSISWEKSDKVYNHIDDYYHDLIPWVRLANMLDKKNHADVTTNFNGKESVFRCYQYAYAITEYTGTRYELAWAPIDKNININESLNPKFITNIEKIKHEDSCFR